MAWWQVSMVDTYRSCLGPMILARAVLNPVTYLLMMGLTSAATSIIAEETPANDRQPSQEESPAGDTLVDEARQALGRERWREAERLLLLSLAQPLSPESRVFAERALTAIAAREDNSAALPAASSSELTAAGDPAQESGGEGDRLQGDIERLHQILAPIRQGRAPQAEHWQALTDLQRLAPHDPLIDQLAAQFGPRWCAGHGSDNYGTWVALRLGRTLVRFRRIPPGTVTTDTGKQIHLAQALWVAEAECSVDVWANLTQQGGRQETVLAPQMNLSPAMINQALAAWTATLPAGLVIRLPTYDEWQYAARAGVTGQWLEQVTTFHDISIDTLAPRPVSTGLVNAYGMYHIHGNAWELVTTPSGFGRVGGGWRSRLADCSFDGILPHPVDLALPTTGFRVVLEEHIISQSHSE